MLRKSISVPEKLEIVQKRMKQGMWRVTTNQKAVYKSLSVDSSLVSKYKQSSYEY